MKGFVAFYFLVIVGITAISCYFAYERQKSELVADMDLVLLQEVNEYKDIVEDYWEIHLPIYEGGDIDIMKDYFSVDKELDPLNRLQLKKSLQRMAQRNEKIRWVAVINPERKVNYLFQATSNQLQILPQDFSYRKVVDDKKMALEVYGEDLVADEEVIALAGGTPVGMEKGVILTGYSSRSLHQIAEQGKILSSLQLGIIRQKQVVFSTDKKITAEFGEKLQPGECGIIKKNGHRYFVTVSNITPQNSRVFYVVEFQELFLKANRYTVMIFLAAFSLLGISLTMYWGVMRKINREVHYLQKGLQEIGENNLDYRIQDCFTQEDFAQIAKDVNTMAQSLRENIDRVYEYQIKQREAELQELQAKFNPHFLYNSLELFRARCYENGDDDTADLIAQTASIFRGFINPRTFITMREELAFSRRYLALFQARYGDSVKILYDIDPEVMNYGIIRNLFQPIIENYFVHGIDPKREDNILRFCGHVIDDNTMRIIVEDNGLGMEEEALEKLSASLKEPISTEKESYGLKNLNQRLQLFYGEGHGLSIFKKKSGGLVVQIDAARWTCQEMEKKELYTKQ